MRPTIPLVFPPSTAAPTATIPLVISPSKAAPVYTTTSAAPAITPAMPGQSAVITPAMRAASVFNTPAMTAAAWTRAEVATCTPKP